MLLSLHAPLLLHARTCLRHTRGDEFTPTRRYWCSDKRPFYLVAPAHRAHQVRTLRTLNLLDKVEEMGIPYADPYNMNTRIKHGIGAGQIGDTWALVLRDMISEAFRSRTSFEWENIFGIAGIPGVAHRTTTEWLQSDHARKSGLVKTCDRSVTPAPIAWLDDDSEHESLKTDGDFHPGQSWMDGINVLDISRFLPRRRLKAGRFL